MPTPGEVARWMFEQLKQVRYLYQEVVVYQIIERFGEQFTYINENGNPAINREVLTAFRKLTERTVVWERGDRVWRFREDDDEPGRQQD